MGHLTNYKALRNRCSNCGHRKGMHPKMCQVLMGDGQVGHDEPCPCKRTYKVVA